ncbi:MAG: tRNA lysidine(34) synthetase TilS [Alphaproteobacteria bacterium]
MTGDTGGDTGAAVFAELDRLVPDGTPGIAVSGGGDSTALLIVAARWAGERGRTIAAATVDHGLRAESAAEAAGVAALCARLGIAHQILRTGNLRDVGGNLSAAAREARFSLLGDWARARGLSAVLLGHTMDDQAETVLMRLARGSGAEGLSAMQARSQRSGVLWLRPLLGVRRDALRAILRAGGTGWIEDPSNEDTKYDRVKARRALAALAPLGIDVEGLARTAWHLRRQRRVLERAMDDLARRARCWGELGELRLDLAAMAGDEPDTALRLLADSLVRVSGAVYRPRFRALWEVLDRVLSGEDAATTLSGCLIRSDGKTALICREPGACEPMRPLGPGATLWDRRWRVSATGAWPASARLGALGEPGLAALRAGALSGAWTAPLPWASALRAVRRTTPAIWGAPELDSGPESGLESPVLLAAPLADYLDWQKIGPECTIMAENTGAGELPLPTPPTYGPAGPGDPPPLT